MDEKKLKNAFSKVRIDMDRLFKEINSLKNNTSKETKSSLGFNADKFDNFVKNVEDELKSINLRINEIEDSNIHNSQRVDLLNKDIVDLDEKTQTISKYPNMDDADDFDERLGEFAEMINEKVSLETSSIRLEFTEEVAKIYDKCFNEILNLKSELNKIKKSSDINKTGARNSSFTNLNEQDKEGKIKKVIKWLFIDEDYEDEDIKDIKKSVKKK